MVDAKRDKRSCSRKKQTKKEKRDLFAYENVFFVIFYFLLNFLLFFKHLNTTNK